MTRARWWLALGGIVAGAAPAVAAQDSQFGIRGPGMPGRAESARARATGGAFAAFDALSPLTDAALADLRRLTASGEGTAWFRSVNLGGVDGEARATRFPSFVIIGPPLGGSSKLAFGVGYSTYLDETYRIEVRDSATVRGSLVRFNDITASDGAVADVRVAAAWRFSRSLAIGAGVHLLSGATRGTASRVFDDSATYHNTIEIADVQHTGMGFSAGGLLDVTASLRLALWYRSDTRLLVSVKDVETARYDLPTGVGGGLRWAPSPELRLAASGAWRSWEDAGGKSTVEWSLGAEGGSARLPARFGVRGATLPFAPPGVDAKEFAVAGGFGRTFSEGRARFDFTVERLARTGGDLKETVWSLFLGLTVQP